VPDLDEGFQRANSEANEAFTSLAALVEESVTGGATEISVLETARSADIDIDELTLRELRVPDVVPIYPFVPWHIWFPWRPIWCWWWSSRYPWYRCCDYWWYRCHWWD
jgi:hypothetical protein